MYERVDDTSEVYLSIDYILSLVTQEDIFLMVFNSLPEEYEYVTSPLRPDNSPGCWFAWYNDKLRFNDFANWGVYNRISLKNIDCFDCVQVFFKLKNFKDTLKFIKTNLIDQYTTSELLERKNKVTTVKKTNKKKFSLFALPREWQVRDEYYWNLYGITINQLKKDRVFPVSRLILKNTRKGNINLTINDIGYIYTDFTSNNRKVYLPTREKKFISTCTEDDIGGINNLVPFGRKLVITKSYKDYRVLKNQGLNVLWFQNEGQVPSYDKLKYILNSFRSIYLFFDNDFAGLLALTTVKEKLLSYSNTLNIICLSVPKSKYVSDPADYYKHKGKAALTQLLKTYNL